MHRKYPNFRKSDHSEEIQNTYTYRACNESGFLSVIHANTQQYKSSNVPWDRTHKEASYKPSKQSPAKSAKQLHSRKGLTDSLIEEQ